MRAPLVIPHPSKKQHIKLKVQACIRPSLQLISINNHSQQLSFFCAGYPAWSFTYPSLHLTIPQKYIDSILWVTTTRSKKDVKQYFPDWHSKYICPRCRVWSLTVPIEPAFDHSANIYRFIWVTDDWWPLGTILYYWLTLVNIMYHLVSLRTIWYHWVPSDTIGCHWVASGPLGTTGYYRVHWVPSGTIRYYLETQISPLIGSEGFIYFGTYWVTEWLSDEARPWDAYASKNTALEKSPKSGHTTAKVCICDP